MREPLVKYEFRPGLNLYGQLVDEENKLITVNMTLVDAADVDPLLAELEQVREASAAHWAESFTDDDTADRVPKVKWYRAKCALLQAELTRVTALVPDWETPGEYIAMLQAQHAALLARTVALEEALRMVVEKLKAYGMQRSSLSGMLWCYPHFTQAECELVEAALAPRPHTEEGA